MSSGILRWENPPPSRTGHAGPKPLTDVYQTIREELMARPDEWAVIHEGPNKSCTSLANQFRRGKYRAFYPIGAFEFVSRTDNEQGRIYARYLGEFE